MNFEDKYNIMKILLISMVNIKTLFSIRNLNDNIKYKYFMSAKTLI